MSQKPDTDHPTIESSLKFEKRRDREYKLREQMRYAAMRFRVWHIPQVPGKVFHIQCNSLATAIGLTNVLAHYDLFQLANRIKPDYTNANGIEYYDHEDGTWTEFEVEDELEDYREAMMSSAVMLVDGVDEPIPGWVLEPGEVMRAVD
jgi:hypothetical protein